MRGVGMSVARLACALHAMLSRCLLHVACCIQPTRKSALDAELGMATAAAISAKKKEELAAAAKRKASAAASKGRAAWGKPVQNGGDLAAASPRESAEQPRSQKSAPAVSGAARSVGAGGRKAAQSHQAAADDENGAAAPGAAGSRPLEGDWSPGPVDHSNVWA